MLKAGLVLSGGGSLGAFEAGAVKALAEMGLSFTAIAGASIGALNGSVLASAPELKAGSEKLITLWRNLSEENVLQANVPGLFVLLASFGLSPSALALFQNEISGSAGFCSSEVVRKLLEEAVQPQNFDSGPAFFVSVSRLTEFSRLEFLAAVTGLGNTNLPDWVRIQDFPVSERLKPVLASAAIPLIFSPQQIGNNLYVDGAMSDWVGETGNTPAPPLVEFGCDPVIVILLNRSSQFNRLKYPGTTIIEIRPQKEIYNSPSLLRIINFNKHDILAAMEDGYNDAMRKMRQIMEALERDWERRAAFERLQHSVDRLDESRQKMRAVMERLKNKKIE